MVKSCFISSFLASAFHVLYSLFFFVSYPKVRNILCFFFFDFEGEIERSYLRHLGYTACGSAKRHASLQVVDYVANDSDEDEQDEDNNKDDDVALHDGKGSG